MQCPYYASCKAFGPFNGTCVCNEQVPNYEDQVCSTDDVTYQNTFSLQKDSCLKHRNIIFKKPGTCERKLKKKKGKKGKRKDRSSHTWIGLWKPRKSMQRVPTAASVTTLSRAGKCTCATITKSEKRAAGTRRGKPSMQPRTTSAKIFNHNKRTKSCNRC